MCFTETFNMGGGGTRVTPKKYAVPPALIPLTCPSPRNFFYVIKRKGTACSGHQALPGLPDLRGLRQGTTSELRGGGDSTSAGKFGERKNRQRSIGIRKFRTQSPNLRRVKPIISHPHR